MLLTKSKFMQGLECPYFLWRMFNEPKSIKEHSISEEFILKQGEEVGVFAQKLFPNGISMPQEWKENLSESKIALEKRVPLFEAGFLFNNCFSRADILVPNEDGWDVIEVKSTSKVKDVHVYDVAFQKYVYEGCGLNIKNCFLLHLNKEYVRNGEINLTELFTKEDITSSVSEIQDIPGLVEEMNSIVSSSAPKAGLFLEKRVKEGHHNCLKDGCVTLPENSVFDLYRGGVKSLKLFEQGVIEIKDIPKDVKLTSKQSIQRESKEFVDKEGIKKFLSQLKEPIQYLDFETFSTAIPMFDGLKPYAKVPFQFSLHNETHHEFLYDGKEDPRESFLIALKEVLGKGTVLVYNQGFEMSVLRSFGERFPSYKEWVDDVLLRVVDLLIPFREFSYYNPEQKGSASIKAVLPALCDLSYEGMEVSDGQSASIKFFLMTYEDKYSKEEKRELRNHLLKYCKLDTLAEVKIVERLNELVRD